MNGNSCKDETSERVEPEQPQQQQQQQQQRQQQEETNGETSKEVQDVANITRIFKSENVSVGTDAQLESGTSGNPSGSSYYDTGSPSDLSPPKYSESERDPEMIISREDEDPDVSSVSSHTFCPRRPDELKPPSPNPSLRFPIVKEPARVRPATGTNERAGSERTIGPPPSYSFVMKQKRWFLKPFQSSSEVAIPNRPPPPTYPGIRGLYRPTESGQMERICNIPSISDPIWRSRSQPALCRRCGVLVLTTTHSHNSIATHVVVFALCLFGCWPCCLLPYCMNSCKNTYHHCPICQGFLGTYTPW